MFDDPELPLKRIRRRRRRWPAIVGGVVVAILVAGVGGAGIWAANNPQHILDRVTVWQFEPTADIAGHVERLKLTEHGEYLYYASQPEVNSGKAFEASCPSRDEDFGILGCYRPAEKLIYIFDVTDDRLDGTEEVTAAHELLHAAWDRMDTDERDRLAVMLEAEFDALADDERFQARMEFYAKTEPGQHANELHSIIGTEVRELAPELEEYYERYFTDRGIVVDLHERSNTVLTQLRAEASALVEQLDALALEIEADYEAYTAGYERLNVDVDAFNARADRGEFDNSFTFTRERDALLSRQKALDALFTSIQDRKGQYDAMVIQLGEVDATLGELQRGLNIGSLEAADL